MMLQKKWKGLCVIILTAVLLTGCGEQTKEVIVHAVDAENYNAAGYYWSGPIMKGEGGFYKKGGEPTEFCFQYRDTASGKSLYVCNRPECQHQGDEFCTATSERYVVNGYTMYDGEIYIAAYDLQKADGKRLVLLRLEPDGSALTELTVLKEETSGDCVSMTGNLFIHRGVCFANYTLLSEERTQAVYGTSIYNLIDGTTAQLPEYEYSVRADGTSTELGDSRNSFMGNDNFVYYNEPRKNPSGRNSKTVLCRYNMDDGTIEDMENAFKNYTGIYTTTEPGKAVLTDRFGNLYRYDWNSRELSKYGQVKFVRTYTLGTVVVEEQEVEQTFEIEEEFYPSALFYYAGKTYAVCGPTFYKEDYFYVYVGMRNRFGVYQLDEDMNVQEIHQEHFFDIAIEDHMGDRFQEYLDEQADIASWAFAFMGKLNLVQDVLYLQTKDGLYEWPMSDFVAGNGEFTRIYATEETE